MHGRSTICTEHAADIGSRNLVRVREPASENGTTFDRLEFRVPGGHGFTQWINRVNHSTARVVSDSSTKYLTGYRIVDGVMLPFLERSGCGEGASFCCNETHALENGSRRRFRYSVAEVYDMPALGIVKAPAEGGIIFQAKINGQGPYPMFFDTGSLKRGGPESCEKARTEGGKEHPRTKMADEWRHSERTSDAHQDCADRRAGYAGSTVSRDRDT
jgi:hypothetical protein